MVVVVVVVVRGRGLVVVVVVVVLVVVVVVERGGGRVSNSTALVTNPSSLRHSSNQTQDQFEIFTLLDIISKIYVFYV